MILALAIVGTALVLASAIWGRGGFPASVLHDAYAAHAARASKDVPKADVKRRVKLPQLIEDAFGNKVDTRGKVVGTVYGNSCRKYGFKHGALFLGDKIGPDNVDQIAPGDFVVVQADDVTVNVRRRIRRVAAIHGEFVDFTPDVQGKAHTSRKIEEVSVRVTHLVA